MPPAGKVRTLTAVRTQPTSTLELVVEEHHLDFLSGAVTGLKESDNILLVFGVARERTALFCHIEHAPADAERRVEIPLLLALNFLDTYAEALHTIDSKTIDMARSRDNELRRVQSLEAIAKEQAAGSEAAASTGGGSASSSETEMSHDAARDDAGEISGDAARGTTTPSPVKKPAAKPASAPRAASVGRGRKAAVSASPAVEHETNELSPVLQAALESVGLGGHANYLRKLGILGVDMLREHSMSELEYALKMPQAGGHRFVLTAPFRRKYASIGIREGPHADPADSGDAHGPGWLKDAVASLAGVTGAAAGGVAAGAAAPSDTGGHGSGTLTPQEVGDGDGEMPAMPPATAPGAIVEVVTPWERGLDAGVWRELVANECPAVAALYGSHLPTVTQLLQAAKLAGKLAGGDAFPAGEPNGVEEVVDALDNLLCLLAATRTDFSPESMRARAHTSARAANRWLDALTRTAAPTTLRGGSGSHASELTNSALLLEAATQRELSAADQKIPEEIEASRARFEAVAKSPTARACLQKLATPPEAGKEPYESLIDFADTLGESADVAALLYSAHVKTPTGAALVALGDDGKRTVKWWREARANLGTMAEEEGRDMLPDNAEVRVLVDALLSGEVGPKEGRKFSLDELANPKPSKSWLGLEKAKGAKAADSARDSVVHMLTVMPAFKHLFAQLHPLDVSVYSTLSRVESLVSKGLKRHGVEAAVDSVLSPLLREYEKEWTRFQKSEKVPPPVLASVWAKVKLLPAVQGYLAQAAVPQSSLAAAPPAAAPGKTELSDKTIKAIAAEMVKKGARTPTGQRTPGTRTPTGEGEAKRDLYIIDVGDKPDGSGANWQASREKKILRRALAAGATDEQKALVKRKDGQPLP